MLRASVVVIASVPKKYLAFITIISGVLIGLGLGIVYKADKTASYALIGDTRYSLLVSSTEEARKRGLSGKDNLAHRQAMLFVFDNDDQRCFWMKDMRFSIDIVWLDKDARVTAVEHGLAPGTYPTQYCHSGKYVIELSGGEALRTGVAPGDSITLHP